MLLYTHYPLIKIYIVTRSLFLYMCTLSLKMCGRILDTMYMSSLILKQSYKMPRTNLRPWMYFQKGAFQCHRRTSLCFVQSYHNHHHYDHHCCATLLWKEASKYPTSPKKRPGASFLVILNLWELDHWIQKIKIQDKPFFHGIFFENRSFALLRGSVDLRCVRRCNRRWKKCNVLHLSCCHRPKKLISMHLFLRRHFFFFLFLTCHNKSRARKKKMMMKKKGFFSFCFCCCCYYRCCGLFDRVPCLNSSRSHVSMCTCKLWCCMVFCCLFFFHQ